MVKNVKQRQIGHPHTAPFLQQWADNSLSVCLLVKFFEHAPFVHQSTNILFTLSIEIKILAG